MSVFNAQVNVGAVDVVHPEETNHLEVTMELFLPLPIGGGKTAPIHFGTIHFPIDKASALKWSGDMAKLAETLKNESGVLIADDIGAVEEAAKRLEELKGGGK